MKKQDIEKLSPNIKETDLWSDAESEYSFLFSNEMMPDFLRFGAKPLTNKQFTDELKKLVKNYPFYYPAYLDMGCRLLIIDIEQAKKALDIGFEIAIKISSWEVIDLDYDIVFENMEKLFHPELVVHYAMKLIEKFPDKAVHYDSAAYALATMGEKEKALEFGIKAVELNPKNSYYLNNLGMCYLELNRFDEAEKYFKLSINADKNHKNPVNNLADCLQMKALGLSNTEFSLLPFDMKKIEELEKQHDSDDLHNYVNRVNLLKLTVFKETLLKKSQNSVNGLNSLIKTLKGFFNFIDSISDEYFIWEEIVHLQINFEQIMNMFIIKHSNVDDDILDELYQSIYQYYGFLSENNIVKKVKFDEFKKYADSLKPGLFDKMHKYNLVRNGIGKNAQKKQEILHELFNDDHLREYIF